MKIAIGLREVVASEVEASTIKNIERLFLTGQPFCFVKRNHSL
ncbi:hypothetical protein M098_0412 [Phocaeicola vulgatus str. 3775 SR(B) 19]|nr:hypothetical protein M098_0412 [Phocaeicola vulgatus str. 3775 SR(B) 19]